MIGSNKMSYSQDALMGSMMSRVGWGRSASGSPWKEYMEMRNDVKQKQSDMGMQYEEYLSTYSKGHDTAYGDSNTNPNLFENYGVMVKRQNGSDINETEIHEIKIALDDLFDVFGNRSSMAKSFGLKISHSGDKKMHARNASGLFIPSMKAMGVTAQEGQKGTGMILAHEWGHFMDYYVGTKGNQHYFSDDPQSTAGQIANIFRKTMSKSQSGDYQNRTCECFARSMEQYWAIKTNNTDILASWDKGNHPTNEVFKDKIMPLIDKFMAENNEVLKSMLNHKWTLGKSATHKYVKRESNGKGGWRYWYGTTRKERENKSPLDQNNIQLDKKTDEYKPIHKNDFPESITKTIPKYASHTNEKTYETIDRKNIKSGFVMHGEKFFVIKDGRYGYRTVELKTGMHIGSGSTSIKGAEEEAVTSINKYGKEKLKASIGYNRLDKKPDDENPLSKEPTVENKENKVQETVDNKPKEPQTAQGKYDAAKDRIASFEDEYFVDGDTSDNIDDMVKEAQKDSDRWTKKDREDPRYKDHITRADADLKKIKQYKKDKSELSKLSERVHKEVGQSKMFKSTVRHFLTFGTLKQQNT
jgi:hypothetical protein